MVLLDELVLLALLFVQQPIQGSQLGFNALDGHKSLGNLGFLFGSDRCLQSFANTFRVLAEVELELVVRVKLDFARLYLNVGSHFIFVCQLGLTLVR